ncbi:hypothetical protein [Deinococcus sp.]|uniref:GNAT family N-acetyltransferase n=1 Tax=Deinococcus sp. TaxID=47478 RepID=UPI002869A80B|nr:hypothetical protein [Deinococcus sp.]
MKKLLPIAAQLALLRGRVARLRALREGGHGTVYGAFDPDRRMVTGLGIYRGGPGLARYQSVETLPHAQGRGLASALVIAADPTYHAQRLYERVGFNATEWQVGFLRRPDAAPRPTGGLSP